MASAKQILFAKKCLVGFVLAWLAMAFFGLTASVRAGCVYSFLTPLLFNGVQSFAIGYFVCYLIDSGKQQ